jgi:hypothetical protein
MNENFGIAPSNDGLMHEHDRRGLDPKRLRYVTENFHILQSQGLNLVVLGLMFLEFRIEEVLGGRWPWWWDLLFLAGCVAGIRYIPRYYRHRFGWIEPRTSNLSNKLLFVLIPVFLILLFFGTNIGRFADAVAARVGDRLHEMISDPTHRANLNPILWWLWFLSMDLTAPLWRSRRVDDHALYISCVGVLFWSVVILYPPLRYPEIMQFTIWKILNAGWLGISFIALGLYGHLTLVRLLPKRIHEEDGDENE